MKDIFGKSSRHLLSGLAEQKDLEITLATIPSPRILRRADQLWETLLENPLSPTQLPTISLDDAVEMLLNAEYRIYSPKSQKAARKGGEEGEDHPSPLIFSYKIR